MAYDPLRRAQKDYRKGRYARVLSQLEPLALSYRDSHAFYFLMGSSCLYTGDVGGASTYLRRAEQLNFRHSATQAALAAVHVRRGDTDKAVQLYLDILGREPGNRLAQRALSFLKSNSDPDRIAAMTKSGGLSVLYPRPPLPIRLASRAGFPLLASLAAAALALFVLPGITRGLRDVRPARSGMEGFSLSSEERKNPVASSGNFEYILTEKEAVTAFDRAKRQFAAWNDEAALVEINRILLSNAAPSIKNKAETLKGFARDPDFTNVKERFAYSEVARSPRLFDGVAILWKGTATNVREGESGPIFDFLVGYHEKKNLEGIATASFSFPLRITPGAPLEILGRIRPAVDGFQIEGIAVHELREGSP